MTLDSLNDPRATLLQAQASSMMTLDHASPTAESRTVSPSTGVEPASASGTGHPPRQPIPRPRSLGDLVVPPHGLSLRLAPSPKNLHGSESTDTDGFASSGVAHQQHPSPSLDAHAALRCHAGRDPSRPSTRGAALTLSHPTAAFRIGVPTPGSKKHALLRVERNISFALD